MKQNYSVLMSVYYKENPEFLKKSMDSIFNQTVKTNDFVLVCDGPLTKELDKTIIGYQKKYKNILHVVRLENNMGLGNALRIGILECKNEFIARMDSDDISKPERCEKQLNEFKNDPSLSIVGSNIVEFSENPSSIESLRVVPEFNNEIISFSKTRNPFNHPSVMYKKSAVIDSGNYRNVRFMQDYYLWIDMLTQNKKGYNIQEPLVLMRAGNNLFKRRSGKEYFKIQKNLFKLMREKKYITQLQYIKSITIRTLSSFAPNWIRKSLFKSILRKKVSE